ncbi:Uncharacterised protein [Mycobacteroides abscessus subsp. abscessus]|nr:Uncharacterised protein [Mycobacteroides abscessus subsp. abscessus]
MDTHTPVASASILITGLCSYTGAPRRRRVSAMPVTNRYGSTTMASW